MKKNIIYATLFLLNFYLTVNSQWIRIAQGIGGFHSVFFTSRQVGYLGGVDDIFKTTNGGYNWTSYNAYGNNLNFEHIQFINQNTGLAIGNNLYSQGQIFKTTNAGLNWSRKLLDVNEVLNINCIGNFIFVSGGRGTFFRSTDTGENWQKIYRSDTDSYRGISFLNVNTGYLAGEGASGIIKTTNGGYNWTAVPGMFDTVERIQFITDSLGYLAKSYAVLKTTNGGNNWSIMYIQPVSLIDEMKFISPSIGWLACGGGSEGARIIATSNGGINWTVQLRTLIYGDWFLNIYVSDSICAAPNFFGQSLYTTTNGGGIFPSVSGIVKYGDNNQPVNSGYVKAVVYDSVLNKVVTVDSTVILPNGYYILDSLPSVPLDFMGYSDDELDFVPTYYDTTIYWRNAISIIPSGNIENIDIKVKRINNAGSGTRSISGHISGNFSVPVISLDNAYIYALAGNQFKNYGISQVNGFFEVDSLFDGTYTLVIDRMGYLTRVINVTISGVNIENLDIELDKITGITKISESVPLEFLLHQNYPNPFNPLTKIRFSLPSLSVEADYEISLDVYDVLGREVASLLSHLRGGKSGLQPGTYEIDFDGSNLPSGFYFYTFLAGDYKETKKMVLVK